MTEKTRVIAVAVAAAVLGASAYPVYHIWTKDKAGAPNKAVTNSELAVSKARGELTAREGTEILEADEVAESGVRGTDSDIFEDAVVEEEYSVADLTRRIQAVEQAFLGAGMGEDGGEADIREQVAMLQKIVSELPSLDLLETKLAAVDEIANDMNRAIEVVLTLSEKIDGPGLEKALAAGEAAAEISEKAIREVETVTQNQAQIEQRLADQEEAWGRLGASEETLKSELGAIKEQLAQLQGVSEATANHQTQIEQQVNRIAAVETAIDGFLAEQKAFRENLTILQEVAKKDDLTGLIEGQALLARRLVDVEKITDNIDATITGFNDQMTTGLGEIALFASKIGEIEAQANKFSLTIEGLRGAAEEDRSNVLALREQLDGAKTDLTGAKEILAEVRQTAARHEEQYLQHEVWTTEMQNAIQKNTADVARLAEDIEAEMNLSLKDQDLIREEIALLQKSIGDGALADSNLAEELAGLLSRLDGVEKNTRNIETTFAGLAEIADADRGQLANMREQLDAAREEVKSAKADLETFRQAVANHEEQQLQFAAWKTEMQGAIEKNNAEVFRLAENIEVEMNLSLKDQNLIKEELALLQKAVGEGNRPDAMIDENIAELRARMEAVEKTAGNIDAAMAQLAQLAEESSGDEVAIAELRERLEGMRSEFSEAQGKLAEMSGAVESQQQQQVQLAAENSAIQSAVEKNGADLARLTEDIEAEISGVAKAQAQIRDQMALLEQGSLNETSGTSEIAESLALLERRMVEVEKNTRNMETSFATLSELSSGEQGGWDQLREQVAGAKGELAKLQAEVKEVAALQGSLQQGVAHNRQNIGILDQNVRTLSGSYHKVYENAVAVEGRLVQLEDGLGEAKGKIIGVEKRVFSR